MAKLTLEKVFKAQVPRSETVMDKTSRIAREMVDDEAEQRQIKNARLRKARLEREACTPTETVAVARKTGRSKAATKR